MSPPWAVVDTNVVVAGLLTSNPISPTARILDSMLAGRLSFLLSVALLAEYGSVLLRPRISALHGLDEEAIDLILEELACNGALRRPGSVRPGSVRPGSVDVAPGDADDRHLWELLGCETGAVLVTGDRALLSSPPAWGSVVTPAAWIERWPGGDR